MTIKHTHPNRISSATRDNLDKRGKEIFDTIERTRGGVWGPYSALMHIPELADRVASVGEYLRFHGILKGSERELAILTCARLVNSRFEWKVHEPLAQEEGTRQEAIEYLRTGKEVDLQERESLIISSTESLAQKKSIDEILYSRLAKEFTTEEIIELYTIAGFYQLLAYIIAGFDVPEPDSDLPSF